MLINWLLKVAMAKYTPENIYIYSKTIFLKPNKDKINQWDPFLNKIYELT
jgi:hypothetical protein